MKINRSISSLVLAAGVAVAAFGFAGTAQAQDVFWSVGVASPGVQLGVTNARPVYARPVYVQPQPVYVAPPPMVYVQPSPYYVAQPRYVQVEGPRYGYQREWHHGRDHRWGDRFAQNRFEGDRSGHDRGDHRRD